MSIDIEFFYLINGSRHWLLDHLMPLFSSQTFIIAAFVAISALATLFYGRRAILAALVAVVLVAGADFICGQVAKPFFKRPRPYCTLDHLYLRKGGDWRFIKAPIERPGRYAFPSCHATNTAAAGLYLALVFPRIAPLSLMVPLLTGYSRIYGGHHYPLDVLAGYLLGGGLALAVWGLSRFFWLRRKK
ncbi:phosphatase PAP2 family protein [Thermosulfuriphilus sp.]